MHRLARLAVLSLAGALLAGCASHRDAQPATASSTASSTASTRPDLSGIPHTAHAAFGDPAAFDPCSIVDLAALGSGSRYGDPQSLDYCVVEPASGGELHVGPLVAAPGGAGVVLQPARTLAGSCVAALRFADRIALQVSTTPSDCAGADRAMTATLRRIATGTGGQHAWPAGSFGRLTACAVLTADDLAPLAIAAGRPTPSRHECDFAAAHSGGPQAALVLAAAYARFDGGPSSTQRTIAGQVVVFVPDQPDNVAGECVGYVPHIPFPSRSGAAAMEMAELHVVEPGRTSAEACATAQHVAARVAPRLPR